MLWVLCCVQDFTFQLWRTCVFLYYVKAWPHFNCLVQVHALISARGKLGRFVLFEQGWCFGFLLFVVIVQG